MLHAAGEGELQLNQTAVYANANMQTEACANSLNALDSAPQQADMRYSSSATVGKGVALAMLK